MTDNELIIFLHKLRPGSMSGKEVIINMPLPKGSDEKENNRFVKQRHTIKYIGVFTCGCHTLSTQENAYLFIESGNRPIAEEGKKIDFNGKLCKDTENGVSHTHYGLELVDKP